MERGSKEKAVMTRLEDNVPVPSLHLGNAVDQLLQWMLEADVRQRCPSFRLLLDALTKARNQLEVSALPHMSASSAKPVVSKRNPLSWLTKPKKDEKPEISAPYSAQISPPATAEVTLFDSDSFARPVPLEVYDEGPCCPISFAPVGGDLFDSDTFAHTVPLYDSVGAAAFNAAAPAEPTVFSPVGSCPPSPFSSEPIGGTLFDSDSFATTCLPTDFAPIGSCAPEISAPAPAGGSMFDFDTYATSCVLPAPGFDRNGPRASAIQDYPADYTSAPRMSQVQFSAIAPKEARKEDYSIIQLFMYEQAFRAAVEEAIAMADTPVQEKRSGFQRVRDNTRVKIVLTCPDMQIVDNVQEQVWCGGYLQFDFAICPPETFRKRQILLTAAVYFDDVPATRLMLTIKALASYEEEIELTRHDIITAFVSYASQDRNRVGALVQGMRKARPDMDIFFDIVTLRSGENWENTLYKEILSRDILFLCWSRNAMASDWVEREWRYALEHKGLESIEPIPLEQPDICPPPKELWSKHFNDSLLYVIGGTTPADGIDHTMPVSPTFPAVPATAQPANIFPVDPVNDNKDKILNPVVGWLVCIQGASRGTDFRIHNQYNYIGRAKHMHICIPTDPLICAEKAAVLAYDNTEKTFLFSPGSGNTLVRVNGSLILSAVVLKAYDVLTIGNTQLLFIPLCGDHFDWNNQ